MRSEELPPIPIETFEARRMAAARRLGDGVLLLPAAAEQRASRDTERPYVADRELFWLCGVSEPEAVGVLIGGDEPSFELFVRARDPEAELWAGPRPGPEATAERLGLTTVHALAELPDRLPELLARGDRIHFRPGRGDEVERMVFGALSRARARGQRTGGGPRGIVDPGETLDDLRLVKDAHELARIRAACSITVRGHRAGAAAIGEGVGEWVVEAAVEGAFRAAGAGGPSFETIVGSGSNACVLHYVDNAAVIPAGGLVLVDAGAEAGHYAGDVTRTWPASGSFTSAQRDVYDLVDAARRAAVDAGRPGATIADVHDAAVRVLTVGLVDLGVLEGDPDALVEQEAYKPYYPHQTSHWLGLDVHDPGDYARAGAPRRLEAGMVFTVEPGLYFRSDVDGDRAGPFAGIGVRIEDDVAITSDGHDVLTAALPTESSAVEQLVGR